MSNRFERVWRSAKVAWRMNKVILIVALIFTAAVTVAIYGPSFGRDARVILTLITAFGGATAVLKFTIQDLGPLILRFEVIGDGSNGYLLIVDSATPVRPAILAAIKISDSSGQEHDLSGKLAPFIESCADGRSKGAATLPLRVENETVFRLTGEEIDKLIGSTKGEAKLVFTAEDVRGDRIRWSEWHSTQERVARKGAVMFKPVEVEAREPYKVWLRYEDGTQGEVDLSDLAGRGVFEAFEDRAFFEAVTIGQFGEIAWGGDIDLDPYMLYMRLTGKNPEELFPSVGDARTGA